MIVSLYGSCLCMRKIGLLSAGRIDHVEQEAFFARRTVV